MLEYKKKIVEELTKLVKKNNSIFDIWTYGSFKDEFSDIDIIVVYQKPLSIPIFSKTIKNKIYDGTIIYIPKRQRYKIFLFERLKIFSIKNKKFIVDKTCKKYKEYRELTSFLERYYERRQKLKKIHNACVGEKIRFIKSLIFSYNAFYTYCKYIKLNIQKTNYLKKYYVIRKNLLFKKNNIRLEKFINELKKFDKKFCSLSIKILENIFKRSKTSFSYKFNSYTDYKYVLNKKNDIPFLIGELYNFYATQKYPLSKRIREDFNPKNKFYVFNNDFEKYLKKKIYFLNECFVDLRKVKQKKGLYRLTWYLNEK